MLMLEILSERVEKCIISPYLLSSNTRKINLPSLFVQGAWDTGVSKIMNDICVKYQLNDQQVGYSNKGYNCCILF